MKLNSTEKKVLISLLAVLFAFIAIRYFQDRTRHIDVRITHPEAGR